MSRGTKKGNRKADEAQTETTVNAAAPVNNRTFSTAKLTVPQGSGNSPHVQLPNASVLKPSTACQTHSNNKGQLRPGPSLTANAIGLLLVAVLLMLCQTSPGVLPHAYLAFAAIGLPWRCISFARRRYTFFLADFCYFANIVVVLFLLLDPAPAADSSTKDRAPPAALTQTNRQQQACTWRPQHSELWAGLQASVYVLAEGPLAAAILAWRCAWVVGSPDHTISVLIHLLPGLAMTAHRYTWQPQPQLHQQLCDTVTARGLNAAQRLQGNWRTQPSTGSLTQYWQSTQQNMCGLAGRAHAKQLAYTCAQPRAAQAHITQQWLAHCEQLLCTWCAADLAVPAASQAMHSSSCTFSDPTAACVVGIGPASKVLAARHTLSQPISAAPLCGPAAYGLWLLAVPIALYMLWQLMYFLVVQVACRSFILCHGYDTSYNALARRSLKAGGGPISNFVRRGSTMRRVVAYGAVQLAFTLCSMGIGIVAYTYQPAAILWQVVKMILPLYWGFVDSRQRKAQARWE